MLPSFVAEAAERPTRPDKCKYDAADVGRPMTNTASTASKCNPRADPSKVTKNGGPPSISLSISLAFGSRPRATCRGCGKRKKIIVGGLF
jgi:hypothetical protein